MRGRAARQGPRGVAKRSPAAILRRAPDDRRGPPLTAAIDLHTCTGAVLPQTRLSPEAVPPPALVPRILGQHGAGERAGPLLLIVAGMHGNEPGGVEAVGRVFERLGSGNVPIRGEIVALSGNRPALAAGVRYVGEDLNRLWTEGQVARLRALDTPPPGGEELEQWELLRALDDLLRDRPDVLVLDLHSTSGPGAPFSCISDTLRSRALALSLPLPLILGIEEAIRGTLLDHMEREGKAMLLVEGGQHDHADTAGNLEAAIWLILKELGMLPESSALAEPEVDLVQFRLRLNRATRGLPRVLEVVHRHEIRDGDDFLMDPGHSNFDRLARGTPLAASSAGPVVAPLPGLLLMPLYQPQGTDGFLVGRPIRRSWLGISTWLRALRVDRLLRRLPGVTPHPVLAERVEVDPAVARWGTVQLFHLAGFRLLPSPDDKLRFSRRPEPRRRRG
jgi:predicted deacylase